MSCQQRSRKGFRPEAVRLRTLGYGREPSKSRLNYTSAIETSSYG